MLRKKIKRTLDIVTSSIALIICLPMIITITVLIKLEDGGDVLFTQERAGIRNGRFKIYKFRTMKQYSENITIGEYICEDNAYITRTGKFLRRWGLDELPQLWNVIKGDMSIVGPRPGMPYQANKYNSTQARRLDVKPGITGWAQVNGRNRLTWPERIELDVWYVENWSVALDIKILLMTLPAIFKREFAFAVVEGDDKIVRLGGEDDYVQELRRRDGAISTGEDC